MGIRWTKSRKQTLPKAPKSPDNPLKSTKPQQQITPKTPKTKAPTERKRTFQPKLPGVGKPGAKRQFIHSNFEDFLSRQAGGTGSGDPLMKKHFDNSMNQIDYLYKLTQGPEFDFMFADLKLHQNSPEGSKNCPASAGHGGARSCKAIADQTKTNPWKSWSQVMSAMASQTTGDHAADKPGVWAITHMNCSCHIRVHIKHAKTGYKYWGEAHVLNQGTPAFMPYSGSPPIDKLDALHPDELGQKGFEEVYIDFATPGTGMAGTEPKEAPPPAPGVRPPAETEPTEETAPPAETAPPEETAPPAETTPAPAPVPEPEAAQEPTPAPPQPPRVPRRPGEQVPEEQIPPEEGVS